MGMRRAGSPNFRKSNLSILLPVIHSLSAVRWSADWAATFDRNCISVCNVSRLDVANSWIKCWIASICSRRLRTPFDNQCFNDDLIIALDVFHLQYTRPRTRVFVRNLL